MTEAISRQGNAIDTVQIIYADSHVHIYKCFNLDLFLDAALANFRRVSHDKGIFILFLTESRSEHYFQTLYQSAFTGKTTALSLKRWMVQLTNDPCVLYVSNCNSATGIYLIAGRQISTAENLEVLALMTLSTFEEQPLTQVIDAVSSQGGIPVIPWGFGKWMGRRGQILKALLASNPFLFLGDNSGRPFIWPEPTLFRQAKAQGLKVLPGTDPLPFASEYWRPGSFGFSMAGVGVFDPIRPTDSLKQTLLNPVIQPKAYGSLEKPYRFIRNQIGMQLLKYFKYN